MIKKEKIAAIITGVCLFIVAALFSISIFLSALDIGAEDSALYAFGQLLTSVYGFCSILIPVFLFTAGSFCFSETWSVKKSCILLVSLVPFFTLVFSEHIIRSIIESDSSPAATMKIFTVVSIAILLVIAEFLLAIVLAGHFYDKLVKLGLGSKKDKTEQKDSVTFEEEPAPKEDAGEVSEFHEEIIDDTNKEEDASKEDNADDWTLSDILAKNRKQIQKTTQETDDAIRAEKSKYDELWDLDKDGNVKSDGASFEDYAPLAHSPDEESADDVQTVQEPQNEAEVDESYENEGDIEEIDLSSIAEQNDAAEHEEQTSQDADDESFDISTEESDAENKAVPFINVDTSKIKKVDLIHLDEDEEDDDVISQFEKENMDESLQDDLTSGEDEFAFAEDEEQSEDDFSSEIPFDDFDESQALSTEQPATNIDRLLDDFEHTEDDTPQKKTADLNSSAKNAQTDSASSPKEVSPSVFSQLNDVFSKMDEDAQAELEKNEESSQQNSSKNSEEQKPKVAPLVLKRRPPYKISTDLLTEYKENPYWEIDAETKQASANLMSTLKEFNIEANVTAIRKGPVVTMFEMLPAPGVKLSKIQALQDNIALRLAAKSVRIVAPIPGKRAVGIEVPNKSRAIVSFRECIEQNRPEWKKMQVPVVLGKDIEGETQLMDLVKTPHLLIAGSTGAGKSVCVNSMILSILYKRSPNEVKMILIDPKIVELSLYNGIGHLLTPVITEPKMAMQALQYCLCEMERRYAVLKSLGCRDILSYNQKIIEQHIATEKLPYIIVVVDEFADLMATTGKQLEAAIARLAAKARAIGIHLVLATQRPSVDVITGLIKANIPSRIAFMVSSKMDSRIIIDQMGAEKLLGKGDMLYASSTDPFPIRIQGALVSDQEVENVVNEVKNLWGEPDYIDDEIFVDEDDENDGQMSLFSGDGDDPLYEKALDIVVQAGKASASYVQRKLSIGYNRAARLIEIMEERGIVGPANGSKPREIIHIP